MDDDQGRLLKLSDIIGSSKKGIEPMIPVSRSTWYEWVNSGYAPQKIKPAGTRSSFWRESEIKKFMRMRVEGAGFVASPDEPKDERTEDERPEGKGFTGEVLSIESEPSQMKRGRDIRLAIVGEDNTIVCLHRDGKLLIGVFREDEPQDEDKMCEVSRGQRKALSEFLTLASIPEYRTEEATSFGAQICPLCGEFPAAFTGADFPVRYDRFYVACDHGGSDKGSLFCSVGRSLSRAVSKWNVRLYAERYFEDGLPYVEQALQARRKIEKIDGTSHARNGAKRCSICNLFPRVIAGSRIYGAESSRVIIACDHGQKRGSYDICCSIGKTFSSALDKWNTGKMSSVEEYVYETIQNEFKQR